MKFSFLCFSVNVVFLNPNFELWFRTKLSLQTRWMKMILGFWGKLKERGEANYVYSLVGSFDQNWKCFHIASLLLYQFQFFPCSFQVINFWNIGFGYISFIIWKYFQFLLIELHQSEILHFGIKIGLAHHSPSMRNIKQWTQSLLLSIICNWAFFPSIIRNVLMIKDKKLIMWLNHRL